MMISLPTFIVVTDKHSDKDVYIVSALASFSGDFGTVTLGANQSLNPTIPIKISSPVVSGTARSLFYYFE